MSMTISSPAICAPNQLLTASILGVGNTLSVASEPGLIGSC